MAKTAPDVLKCESGPGLMLTHQEVPGPNHYKEWLVPDDTPTSVYKYYDRDGILLYVGITGRGSTRNSEHNKTKPWWQHVVRQSVEHFSTRERAQRRETDLIRKMAPPFNKQQNRDHAVAYETYFIRRSLGGEEGVRAFIKGRNRVPAVVVNTVGERVTIACPDPRISLDDYRSIRVESGGRQAKVLDVGVFADGCGCWARIKTVKADQVIGAVVMYKHLDELCWPAKVIQLIYRLDEEAA